MRYGTMIASDESGDMEEMSKITKTPLKNLTRCFLNTVQQLNDTTDTTCCSSNGTDYNNNLARG
jgi:hypothetical protein